jgi:hypothetical protein
VSGLGYACALLLAAVFVRAGAAKLARPSATAASFAALGLPGAPWAARGVPFAELLTAVSLIVAPRIGGAAALALLLAFTGLLVRAVRRGSTAPCNCFGAARADPVSGADVVRNALLGGLAGVGLAAGEPGVPAPPAILAAGAAFAVGVAGLGALRRRSALRPPS